VLAIIASCFGVFMATILVIDDEPAMRELVVRILSPAGHSIIEAADGTEGVTLAVKHRPELVITDVIMPGKEGIATMCEIQECLPDTRIVVMSGGTGRNFMLLDIAKALGADAVLAKPFRSAQLFKAVEACLRA
jgi:CheY-like chemotaxis protein